MFSDIRSVQILISLMKQYGIRRVVVSPGNRNVPIVHSMEEDPFFTTYSVVDERSAGFFGIGLIQRFREPVAICCTSGTAVCNYYSAITEAFYQKLPLLVISADRNPYYLNMDEEQMLPQTEGFRKVTKAVFQLPMIKDEADEYTCGRMICEAILELNHHGCGPVQINVPMESKIASFHTKELPTVRKTERFLQNEDWSACAASLHQRKILILYGQSAPLPAEQVAIVERFAQKYGAVIAADLLSNLACDGALSTFMLSRTMTAEQFREQLLPDIVITLNSGYVTYLRSHLKSCKGEFEHWAVNESGNLVDPFQSISKIFELSPVAFLEKLQNDDRDPAVNSGDYRQAWETRISATNAQDAEIPYSDLYVTRELANSIPENAKLHLANSSSVRLISHFDLKPGVEVFCNRGANGIDGSASAYVAMASNTDAPAYLLIGDLSFFYDMNALWNNYITPNMRILLNNNEGATLFHYTVGLDNVPTLDQNISAEHHATAQGWVESRGFEYLRVDNEQQLQKALTYMARTDLKKPIFTEVFTDKEEDAQILKNFYKGFSDEKTSVLDLVKKSPIRKLFSR